MKFWTTIPKQREKNRNYLGRYYEDNDNMIFIVCCYHMFDSIVKPLIIIITPYKIVIQNKVRLMLVSNVYNYLSDRF